MKKPLHLLFLLCTVFSISFGQSPVLVQDYNLGPQGSIDNRIFEFKGVLLYLGTTQLGERAILQYDKSTQEINELLTENDVEGTFNTFTVLEEEVFLWTQEDQRVKNLYSATMNDLTDLEKIYDAGNYNLSFFSYYEGQLMIREYDLDGAGYKTNIKVVYDDGSISILYQDLEFFPFDFNLTSLNDHYIISHETELIDDEFMVAFDIYAREMVPVSNVIPEYEPCGYIQRISRIPGSAIFYECDENKIYDFIGGQFIDFDDEVFFLSHNTEDFLYLSNFNAYYKIDKSTNQQEIILDNVSIARGLNLDHIVFSPSGDFLDVSYIDFENEEIYTYPTEIRNDAFFRLTGFGAVPEGVHTVMYDTDTDNGVIARISPKGFTIIDSVYNVTFNNRPVAYEEDIYFTHQHPEYGNELFWIDYEVSSTQETTSLNSIKIAPNPAQHYITVEHPMGKIPELTSVLDMRGNIIKNNLDHALIDVNEFSSGLFILNTIYTDGSSIAQKFSVF